MKKRQVKQIVKQLCAGTAESYLKWKWQLDEVIKNKPYESPKAKLDMAEAMLHGDLLESWKLWGQTEGSVEVEKKSLKRNRRGVHQEGSKRGQE